MPGRSIPAPCRMLNFAWQRQRLWTESASKQLKQLVNWRVSVQLGRHVQSFLRILSPSLKIFMDWTIGRSSSLVVTVSSCVLRECGRVSTKISIISLKNTSNRGTFRGCLCLENVNKQPWTVAFLGRCPTVFKKYQRFWTLHPNNVRCRRPCFFNNNKHKEELDGTVRHFDAVQVCTIPVQILRILERWPWFDVFSLQGGLQVAFVWLLW